MLIREGKISLTCFILTAVLILGLCIPQFFFEYVPNLVFVNFWGPIFYWALLNMILRLYFRESKDFEVAIRASFLGLVFAVGLFIVFFGQTQYKAFGMYMIVLSGFHWSEYMAIAICNPSTLSTDSFILNHSLHYSVAALASWIEFFIETYFWGSLKSFPIMWIVGLMMCLAGEVVRKLAMYTARSNFTHLVQFEKTNHHRLVTDGIYSVFRHPSYAGWFWWSIGTQIVLCNPICIILYTFASWTFFKDRIYVEEITLVNFFGEEYLEYQKMVPTGLPCIEGFKQAL